MENSNTQKNPLSKYFRQPAIYIKLPSQGKYWPEGSIDMPAMGELPVYPLTTKDEVTLRTPDALMNGAGVVEIIQSCIPNIKNAWAMPNIDVDASLIAIRIASYGETMEIETRCPHCSDTSRFGLNLHTCLASIKSPNYDHIIEDAQIKIKFKPSTYFGTNRIESIEFEQQKMMQALENSELPNDVRATEIQKSMDRLVDISIEILVNSTDYIEVDDSTRVSNPDHIKEFYSNSPSALIKKIQAQLEKFSVEGGIKPQIAKCSACEKDYEIPVLFNYSSFFADGS